MQLSSNYYGLLRRAGVRACCVVLLLAAQQTALTHATWHAATTYHPTEPDHDSRGDSQDKHGERDLCAFDFALTQVLGVEFGIALPLVPGHHAGKFCVRAPHGRLKAEAVAAVSRGPPLLL
ncbi:MAG: hypothetical protein ACT4P8_01585 [Betaproteobacteria bacterium]